MAQDSVAKATASQLKNLEAATGRTMADWAKIVSDSGLQKHAELVNFLKEKHGLGHGNANLVVHTARQSSAASSGDEELVAEQYKGKEDLQPLYNAIVSEVKAFGSDVELSPKKAYVSLRRKKQFALLQPSTKTRLDVGLNLKGEAPTALLEAAGSWNSMCTHRIKLEAAQALNPEVITWLKKAYDAAG